MGLQTAATCLMYYFLYLRKVFKLTFLRGIPIIFETLFNIKCKGKLQVSPRQTTTLSLIFIFSLVLRQHIQACNISCQPLKEHTTAVDIKLYMLLKFYFMHTYVLECSLINSFRSTITISIETNQNINGFLDLRNKCGLRTHNNTLNFLSL